MITNPIAIISENATAALQPRLKAMADFIDNHGGEDLVRHLHAQEVEIVAHSNGALLKCYRTKHENTQEPDDCWRFWSGRYEVNRDHLDDNSASTFGIGFTQDDLKRPVEYILDRTKAGKLDKIEPGTLIVLQVENNEPEVREYADRPSANMVVVGVRYDVSDTNLDDLLSAAGDIEEQAVKWSGRWEGHAQLERVAEMLGTDSLPLFFRGRLTSTEKAMAGIERSAEEDPTFHKIVSDFLAQAGDEPTDKDYERFFRHAVQQFGDFEIRKLDKKGKVIDATTATKDAFRDIVDRLYRRFEDAAKEIDHTIETYGRDSKEHQQDYRDLNYLHWWLRNEAADRVFDGDADVLTLAIHSLKEVNQPVDQASVLLWARRHLEEQGGPAGLYAQHLTDQRVPSNRYVGRASLWDQFNREVHQMASDRLTDVIADAK